MSTESTILRTERNS